MDRPYLGRFRRGEHWVTENALDEVWDYIRRHTGREYLEGGYSFVGGGLSKDELIQYCRPRFKQACEFRDSSRNLSLITKPLSLYYSILNLTRAVVAFREEKLVSPAHGLDKFKGSENLLECSARVMKSGSFVDLWELVPNPEEMPDRISFGDCLAQIPEISWQYNSPQRGASLCAPVGLQIRGNGRLILSLPTTFGEASGLEKYWKEWFPDLAALDGNCDFSDPESPKIVLSDVLVTFQNHKADEDKVVEFCERYFLSDITNADRTRVYLQRRGQGIPFVRRECAYLGAMFILGSIVRYEPEILLKVAEAGSESAWLLEKFLKVVERYYPQLMLSLLGQRQIYFMYPTG